MSTTTELRRRIANKRAENPRHRFNIGEHQYLGRIEGGLSPDCTVWGTEEDESPNLLWAASFDECMFATYLYVREDQKLNLKILAQWREQFLDRDDVFHDKFLECIVLDGIEYNDNTFVDGKDPAVKDWPTHSVFYGGGRQGIDKSGPMYIHEGLVYSVSKVCLDPQVAFILAIWPCDKYQGADVVNTREIAVPPRSYSTIPYPLSTRNGLHWPLEGMRIAVQDNYYIGGTRISLGSHNEFSRFARKVETADLVPLLKEVGATVIGKTTCSPLFIISDQTKRGHCQIPLNPRGEEDSLIAGGSSGGSAAAVAAYDWLDLAICSDTTGGTRFSALHAGVFGFHPSTGAVSKKGLFTVWEGLDTPSWVGRDLKVFPYVFKTLHSLDQEAPPDYYSSEGEEDVSGAPSTFGRDNEDSPSYFETAVHSPTEEDFPPSYESEEEKEKEEKVKTEEDVRASIRAGKRRADTKDPKQFEKTPRQFGKAPGQFEKAPLEQLDKNPPQQPDNYARPNQEDQLQILYPTDFIPENDPDQIKATEKFLNDICKATGSWCRRISIQQDWRDSSPVEEKDLNKYLYSLTHHGLYFAAYASFEKYRESYGKSNNLKTALSGNAIPQCWDRSNKVGPKQHMEIETRMSVFKKWFLERYYSSSPKVVVAIHIDAVKPMSEKGDPFGPLTSGLQPTYLAAILGAPEVAIPIAQASYRFQNPKHRSRIMNVSKKVTMPIVISLMGFPKGDLSLLQWAIQALQKTGRPTRVNTGLRAF
ncbi:uncharacterized protein TRUGW13939_06586 [Talaromyces rugulosus]|uniref:Amidase domain-containing protein n=1 Tax=Talaromyces rugulosus TaxID=121627 RepID=A0A7H8QZE0_TALRU|nr:uncharacterized protein TRUGW13939_06586 [Talaromyces rugulosus]QKX59452.1 hypothetical protein TRUGW13939_06586 [Talaromyces rugulosus]